MMELYCIIWCSLEECARYLETIKVYENKPADLIQGHMDTDYLSKVQVFFFFLSFFVIFLYLRIDPWHGYIFELEALLAWLS